MVDVFPCFGHFSMASSLCDHLDPFLGLSPLPKENWPLAYLWSLVLHSESESPSLGIDLTLILEVAMELYAIRSAAAAELLVLTLRRSTLVCLLAQVCFARALRRLYKVSARSG